MILQKIKQNLAGFAAVTMALAGFTAVAPASANGTSTTFGQVGYTNINRGASTVSGNSITTTATIGADEQVSTIFFNASFADSNNQVALQAGDTLRVTVTYTNLTDNSTAGYYRMSNMTISAFNSGTSMNINGNTVSGLDGANNTVTQDVGFNGTSLTTGNYSNLMIYGNLNFDDPSISAGDQLRAVVSYNRVRAGVATPINPLSVQPSNDTGFNVLKTNSTGAHTVVAADKYMNTYSNFCVYRGENGVTNSTQIAVSMSNSGTGNTMTVGNASARNYSSGSNYASTVSGNVTTITLPASGWDVARFTVSGNVSNANLTVGNTFTPVLNAVISGTSTNVADSCARNLPGMAAPAATSVSTSVSLTWTAPTLPISGTWDNIQILACDTALATCGQYVAGKGMFLPNFVWVQSFNFRSNGILSASATSFTATAQNMMAMGGPGQPPTQWSTSGNYKYFVMYDDYDSPYYAVSAVSAAISASGVVQQNVAPQVQPNAPINSMPTEVPILRPTLGLSQGVRAGGTLVLEAANGATVTEVKVDGQAAALEKVPTGVEIVVPTGLTPGAKDLLIKTSTGSTLHVGAIKIADPVLEAQKLAVAKAAASVAFRAPLDLKVSGSNITSRQAAEVREMVRQYRAAKEVVCVAVPATKASTAAARQAAVRACALFKAANRNLRVTILVEAPSGAAANVISTELIG